MSIFKYTISDKSVRDIDNDNILDETRIEKKFICGVCYYKKETVDNSEYVKRDKRKVGYGN